MDLWAKGFDTIMRPLERASFRSYRRWLVPQARGRVLEVGAGTGANLPYLPCAEVSRIVLSDITVHAEAIQSRLEESCFEEAHLSESSAEALPFEEGSFDTVLSTLVFCSVPDQYQGLREVRRVLKPGGLFLFLEHVLPENNRLALPMKVINPAWRLASGGCNLTRRTLEAIEDVGFRLEAVRRDSQGILVAGVGRRV
ncbi:MAG: class I SAM-dependent methyltransferase [Spirochaetaceae bacterium]